LWDWLCAAAWIEATASDTERKRIVNPSEKNLRYPMLWEMLANMNLPFKATYKTSDLAALFQVSVRAIQDRVARGQIKVRDLPGRAKCLPADVEEYLTNSLKRPE
jgi:hypothetical protein